MRANAVRLRSTQLLHNLQPFDPPEAWSVMCDEVRGADADMSGGPAASRAAVDTPGDLNEARGHHEWKAFGRETRHCPNAWNRRAASFSTCQRATG